MKKILISFGSLLSTSLPVIALAAADSSYLTTLISKATGVLSSILVFLISLSVVWFVWNVISYTMSSDEDKRSKAKDQMIWGIVAIAVAVSVWGLVHLLQGIFGLNQGATSFTGGDLGNMIPTSR